MKKEDREKISHLFKQEMLSGLRHHYIKKDSSGISVFGNYHITKTKDGCYRVKQRSWCKSKVSHYFFICEISNESFSRNRLDRESHEHRWLLGGSRPRWQ